MTTSIIFYHLPAIPFASGLQCGWEGVPEAMLDRENNHKDQRQILQCCSKIFIQFGP